MASAAYNAWAASVKGKGGTVVVPATGAGGFNPNTGKRIIPAVLSGSFPLSVWSSKVNSSAWPLPDEYSINGQTAYYHAPLALQQEATTLSLPTTKEIAHGATDLMNQWDIPGWLRSPGKFIAALGNSTVLIVAVAAAVYVVVNRRRGR